MSNSRDVVPILQEKAYFILLGSWPKGQEGGLGIPVGKRVFGVREAGVVNNYSAEKLDWDGERLKVGDDVGSRGEQGLLVIGGYTRNALYSENGPADLFFSWQLVR